MDMITDLARMILYGASTYDMRRKPTISGYLWGIGQNAIRQRLGLHSVSAPGVIDFLLHYGAAWLGWGGGPQLPQGWPAQVFNVVDSVVKARGGSVTVGDGLTVPCFTLDAASAVTLPTMWIAYLNFENDGCDLERVKRAEESIEDAIARRCGRQLNVRVMSKPARIEIDNPKPPMMRLADYWARLLEGKIPSGGYVLGIESSPAGDRLMYNRLDNANEFSIGYFGASGSGKTQAMLSALLSVCATTSPSDLSVIVIDPKALDFPVSGLPHLAHPIITEPDVACSVALSVVEEMDRRVRAGNRESASKRILLVIDELADLLAVQKGDALEQALTRLGQKGRAWGISMMIGSQRAVNTSFPRSVHAQIPARWVGRVMNAGEAAFASGAEGCDAHRLPGAGAAMIYEPAAAGVRLQSLFVADANAKSYTATVGRFVADVQKRWSGVGAHWRLGWQAEDSTDDDAGDTPTIVTAPDFGQSEFDPSFMAELWAAFQESADNFTIYRVKKIYESIYGSSLNHAKAKRAYDEIVGKGA